MKPKSFIRKVGFGLRPEEKLPQDPLNWAKSQMKSVPKLIWPGKIYSEKEMLDLRVDFTTQEDKIQKTEKNPAKAKVKTIMKKLEKLGAITCIQKGKSGSFTRRANLYRREV